MSLIKKIRDSKFLKDGAALISGNVWAQGIAFAAYLILTRLFSREDIGIYNIFFSYIEVLVIVSTCKYEMAVVVCDSERESVAVSRIALRINTIVSVALLTVILILALLPRTGVPLPFPVFNTSGSFGVAMLIPPMVFFCGTSRVYTALLNRRKDFKPIAFSEAIGSTSGVMAKLLFGLPRLADSLLHTVGLPLGTVIGKAASNVNLRLRLHKEDIPHDISKGERRAAAFKHRNFPLFTLPKELVNSLSYNLPFLWLAQYADKAEVGLFALALTFTFRPVNIFNTAFEKLLYVRIAQKTRAGESIKKEIFHFVKYLNLAAIPLFAIVFCFADTIFGILFGGKWAGCGYYVRCLIPWTFISLTSTSLLFIANVFSRQRTEFFFYLLLFALRAGAVLTGVLSGNFRLAILLFSIAGAVVSMAILAWCLRLVSLFEAKTFHSEDNLD
ncbi:MAG: oligosaccharide flippase family protein [Bacteroidales bacterium]|nr:oligosaccharide flippase family protein [Bacteroidales bacterium]